MLSQIGQDKWVLETNGYKKNGYFIEIGAGDGVYASNTHYMEKNLNWSGLCVEPNDLSFNKLKLNRECYISNDLVYSESDVQLNFVLDGTLSGIINKNTGGMVRKGDKEYVMLKSISIKDLLNKYNVPTHIDYCSIDIEGQEYEVLKNFPFDKYTVSCWTIEHNEPHQGPELRDKIRKLMTDNGYVFVKGNDDVLNWGHGPIDDFYVHQYTK